MSASQAAAVPLAAAVPTPPVRGITPTDLIFLPWLAVNSVLLMRYAGAAPDWPLLVFANLLSASLVPLLAFSPRTRFIEFVGGSYPLLLTAAYYPQLGILNIAVAHMHDLQVQGWEQALFGSQVSMTWHQAMPSALLSTILHICYASFYWIVLFAPCFLFFRRSRESFERACFVLTLVLYACYLVFSLFPVAGPRYFFGVATGPEAEVLAARVVHRVLEGGSAWGTAFPSSHVAAAWAAVFVLWKEARGVALVLAPIAVGTALGTVYGQFHYGVDALGGAIAAVVLCALADPLRKALRPASRPSA